MYARFLDLFLLFFSFFVFKPVETSDLHCLKERKMQRMREQKSPGEDVKVKRILTCAISVHEFSSGQETGREKGKAVQGAVCVFVLTARSNTGQGSDVFE